MIKWIVGLNGSGKTVLLEDELEEEINKNSKIITNLKNITYRDFDKNRIDMLVGHDDYVDIFDYGDIEINNNEMTITENGHEYSKNFLNILSLLCRKGDVLILDEPEFGLYGVEMMMLGRIINILSNTYKNGLIATHCQYLFPNDSDNFYWCKEYKLEKISEDELHEHIGKF